MIAETKLYAILCVYPGCFFMANYHFAGYFRSQTGASRMRLQIPWGKRRMVSMPINNLALKGEVCWFR
jgi:hypothetical protein